jgi:hypothetical protein
MLDVKFGPADDPNLKIAWQLNGKSLLSSSRITTITEFGYSVLEINPVTVFDHGVYEVIAVNQLGEARQSAVVEVAGRRTVSIPAAPQKVVDRPNFHADLRSQEIFEGQPLYLESKYSPINDQSMKITFLHNGKPLQNSKIG